MYANLTDEELANLLDVEPHNEEARDEVVRRFVKEYARRAVYRAEPRPRSRA